MNQRISIILGGVLVLIVVGAVMYQVDRNASKKSTPPPAVQLSEKLIDVEETLQNSQEEPPEQIANTQVAKKEPLPTITQSPPSITPNQQQKDMSEQQQKKYQVVLHTTNGDITIDLNATGTPKTVENFVALAKKSFYNSTIFHRVIKGFMIQGGDPECNPEKNSAMCGSGGPGYKFDDELFEGSYTRGTVAMANSGPNTNGSQFFIMHSDYNLPKNYVIFGKVSSGMEVVDLIATAKMTVGGDGAMSKPLEPVRITSAEVKEIK